MNTEGNFLRFIGGGRNAGLLAIEDALLAALLGNGVVDTIEGDVGVVGGDIRAEDTDGEDTSLGDDIAGGELPERVLLCRVGGRIDEFRSAGVNWGIPGLLIWALA